MIKSTVPVLLENSALLGVKCYTVFDTKVVQIPLKPPLLLPDTTSNINPHQ